MPTGLAVKSVRRESVCEEKAEADCARVYSNFEPCRGNYDRNQEWRGLARLGMPNVLLKRQSRHIS